MIPVSTMSLIGGGLPPPSASADGFKTVALVNADYISWKAAVDAGELLIRIIDNIIETEDITVTGSLKTIHTEIIPNCPYSLSPIIIDNS